MVTFTNEASARTGSCVYAIGEERKREREREERKEKRKRESGFWVGKGEQRRSSLLSLREFLSLEARKEGRMVIWTIEISLPRSDGMDDIEND